MSESTTKIILIIDDNEQELKFLKRAFTNWYDCKVITAENGLVGLEKINKESPSIVFLDVAMPVMDGLQMLEKLRLYFERSDITVIALTAMSDSYTIDKIHALGVTEYLIKPISIEKIFSKLDKLLVKKK